MKKRFYLLIVLVGLHVWLLFKLRFTAWPEMMSYPYLYNKGFKLYTDFIYPYPPLLTWILAGLDRLWGYGIWQLKMISWGLVAVNDILIYFIIDKLTKRKEAALWGVGMYIFLQPFLEGNMIWFDTVMVTPLLAALLFLLPRRRLIWAGFALGTACLVKQTAVIFLVVSSLYLVVGEKKIIGVGKLLIGPVVLGSGLVGWLLWQGVFGDFLNWTLIYPLTFWSDIPGYVEMSLDGGVLRNIILLLLPLVVWSGKRGGREQGLLLVFLAGGVAVVYPRFSYFHLQTTLAVLAVLYGGSIGGKLKMVQGALLGIMVLGLVLGNHRYVVAREWGGEVRFWGSDERKKAEIIAERVAEGQKVFLLGEHSGLYVLAERQPARPWSDNFGWYLEIPGVQERLIKRWENDGLDYVFWREPLEPDQEMLGGYQPGLITKWVRDNYTKSEEVWEGTWLWRRKS